MINQSAHVFKPAIFGETFFAQLSLMMVVTLSESIRLTLRQPRAYKALVLAAAKTHAPDL
jgi:hypothetical protein